MSVKRQTVELADAVQQLLDENEVQIASLSGLVCAIGPGSYTGLRIGLGFLKGISLVHNDLPIVGIYTHDIVAGMMTNTQIEVSPSSQLIITVEAGRKRILAARYDWSTEKETWVRSSDFNNPTWPELMQSVYAPAQFVGEISEEGKSLILSAKNEGHAVVWLDHIEGRSATVLARLGWEKLRSGNIPSPQTLTPYYLRSPEGS